MWGWAVVIMSEEKKAASKKRGRRSKTKADEESVEGGEIAVSEPQPLPNQPREKRNKSESSPVLTSKQPPLPPPLPSSASRIPSGKSEADAYVIVSICDSYTPSVALFPKGRPDAMPSNGWTEAVWRTWVEEHDGIILAEGHCDPTVYKTTATYTLEELASG